MKRLAILAIFASPVFAHETTYQSKIFTPLAGGNSAMAQELSWYCSSTGKSDTECAKGLMGSGNLSQEAAQKCVEEFQNSAIKWRPNVKNNEAPGARSHQAEGTHWHKEYVKSPESGRLHRHDYSDAQRELGYQIALTASMNRMREQINALTGNSTTTKESSWGADFVRGVQEVIGAAIGTSVSGSVSLSEGIKLTDAQLEAARKEAEMGRLNPDSVGLKPDILCFIDERDCTVEGGQKITNDQYDPDGQKKADEKDKDPNKKDANNPPKHEDDHTSDIPDVISSEDEDLWAGNDTNIPDTVIATPVMDESLAPQSAMEKCIERETKRLNDEFGKKTIDPNSTNETDKQKQANDLLRHGYCDAEVLGKDFCAKHKFQQDSVIAVDIQEDRKAAAKAALGKLLTKGQCDTHALGTDFCKKNAEKWLKTPADQDPADEANTKTPPIPIRSTNAPRINP